MYKRYSEVAIQAHCPQHSEADDVTMAAGSCEGHRSGGVSGDLVFVITTKWGPTSVLAEVGVVGGHL